MSAHRCARGPLCSAHERAEDGRRIGAGIDAPEGLCRGCERSAGRAIGDLPTRYVELEMIIGQRPVVGEKVSGTPTPAVPPRVDVMALQQDIDRAVTSWASVIARRVRTPWDDVALTMSRPGVRVAHSARFLATRLDALLSARSVPLIAHVAGEEFVMHRSGLDGALECVDLERRARYLVTGGSGTVRLPVPCPMCESPALVRENGSDQVDCRSCGARWPESDYRRLCLILAEDHRR